MSDTPEALMDDVRDLLEVARTSDLGDVDLAAARAAVQAATADLRPHVVDGVRMQAVLDFSVLFDNTAADEVHVDRLREAGPAGIFPYSPYIGKLNPISPPANLDLVDVDGGIEVRGDCTFRDHFNGPPGCVHGGVIAAVMDDILGTVCVVNQVGGFTGTLTVRYRKPTPLQERIELRGWVSDTDGRKTFASATFHHKGELIAEANGVFIGRSLA
jgi:acyl-coenzyme A thioesterase PaaI-like protein